MKSGTRRASLVWTFIPMILALNIPAIAHAQPAPICTRDGSYEPASDIYREVELHQLGIAVSIPENYRAMERQNWSVLILHPDDFDWLQCLSRGGIGGGGYYYEEIALVEPDPSMLDMREQAMWTVGHRRNRDGSRSPGASTTIPYQQGSLQGYIVTSETGTSAVFLGPANNSEQLIRVSAACDCEVHLEDITDLLGRIRLF
ncbi:hypothetical protein [Vacuolonema iberomarrocanum]|uniref:hypothetical protein n=1 Tax=Vacuolonema iberomarrocanum TaxID=3454632 RepID=UPI0019E58BBB|nr:hypothetical protein [filamentous cyanobacterium LEGE 07170]